MDVLQMQTALGRYLELGSEGSKVIATYIFVDYAGQICAKSKTLTKEPASINGNRRTRLCVFSDITLLTVRFKQDTL